MNPYFSNPSNGRKASNSRDVGNSKDPIPNSNRSASFKQGTKAREDTTSAAKKLKVAENEARNMAVALIK